MDLKTYLKGLSESEREVFAKAAGTKWVYLTQLITKFRTPSPALAKRLHVLSGKQIPLHKLRPDIWGT